MNETFDCGEASASLAVVARVDETWQADAVIV
jgi:hypothetical protein